MTRDQPLPGFTEHGANTKLHRMDAPQSPPAYVQHVLADLEMRRGKALRVLDVGCGRGDTVAWLLERGWDAWGVDVTDDYLDRGRDYLRRHGWDTGRLKLLGGDFAYPLLSDSFDVVLSDQVVEHVSELDGFVEEVARVSAAGAEGLHIYPARWRPIEVHMRVPLAHWLPKGPGRRAAISAAIRCGVSVRHFNDRPHRDRVEIFSRFSEDETFYRSVHAVTDAFSAHGLDCVVTSHDKLVFHLPRASNLASRPAALLYPHLFSVVLRTWKR